MLIGQIISVKVEQYQKSAGAQACDMGAVNGRCCSIDYNFCQSVILTGQWNALFSNNERLSAHQDLGGDRVTAVLAAVSYDRTWEYDISSSVIDGLIRDHLVPV